ncbi:MAG: ribosomal protein S18-alanine N-acetyltransferase [Euryarchaeota archaeon]|nr:ribosomal protein S18-alanine N-acetyltransferase [Euryarchaeota archaeon]
MCGDMSAGAFEILMIRKFRPSDLQRVYEIEAQSFRDPYHPLFLINLYELYGETFLVAEVDRRVVGYVIARKVNSKGHIIAIAVDPGFRCRGIGRALMLAVEEELKKMGVIELWLEVRASNTRAMRFYRRLGYSEKEVLKGYYNDGEDAVVFKKHIL